MRDGCSKDSKLIARVQHFCADLLNRGVLWTPKRRAGRELNALCWGHTA